MGPVHKTHKIVASKISTLMEPTCTLFYVKAFVRLIVRLIVYAMSSLMLLD